LASINIYIMELIGRQFEIGKLRSKLESTQSEMIAVYGRRRVGKTFLIKEVFKNEMVFHFTGLYKGTPEEHLVEFSKTLNKYDNRIKKHQPHSNWFDALDALKEYVSSLRRRTKKVIFLDELPWMATDRSRFLTAFSNFWNAWASNRTDIVVVICGSSASWMINKVVKDKGGLHNRITTSIRLEPFNLYETELFAKKINPSLQREQIIKLYMVFGGIPFYLSKINNGESAIQSIDRLCFVKNGELRKEYDILFASLFNASANHLQVVEKLAQHPNGLTRNEITKKTKLKTGGGLTKLLEELLESGFIAQYIPFGKSAKDAKIKLIDAYSLFYHKYIANHTSGSYRSWEKIAATPTWASWSGLAFENICMQHIAQIKKALKIDGIETAISAWHHKGNDEMKGAQIDLLINRADGVINVCEIKYSTEMYFITKKYAEELRLKIASFKYFTKTRKSIFPTLITNIGLQKNIYSSGFISQHINEDVLFADA
jgi:uncharacterized protein